MTTAETANYLENLHGLLVGVLRKSEERKDIDPGILESLKAAEDAVSQELKSLLAS